MVVTFNLFIVAKRIFRAAQSASLNANNYSVQFALIKNCRTFFVSHVQLPRIGIKRNLQGYMTTINTLPLVNCSIQ